METPKFSIVEAISYLKYTSLSIAAFLRDNNLPKEMEQEVEIEVKKTLAQCEQCGVWQSKSSIIDDMCSECSEDDA